MTENHQYDVLNRLTNVLANGSAAAGYRYDAAGNLLATRFGSGVTNLFQYDTLNRLTNSAWNLNASSLASFFYQLGLTGNRTNLSENVNGKSRAYQWLYDNLYRLTNETVSVTAPTGTLGYGFDAVGNRTNRSGSIGSLGSQILACNTNDWLSTDTYDSNGNTLWSTNGSVHGPYYYDVLNRLTNYNNSVYLTYNGDGDRASKTVAGTTTYYLVDDRNPSGYAQVLEEYQGASLTRIYNYGLNLISQRQITGGTVSYYGYDGHGSVRFLTSAAGVLTDTNTYDAYGMLIYSATNTPNNYLYCGQQYDPDLGLYYNRARYLNPNTGRFWSMDSYAGNNQDPASLHKYFYGGDNPVNRIDPTGKWATFIHREAVDHALVTGLLPSGDRQILKDQQDAVDSEQAAAVSYKHAMSNGSGTPPQTPAQAQQQADNYVHDLLTEARAAEAKNDHTTAMKDLGQAMHALQDSTSPAHHGFQPWYDYAGGAANPHEWCHGAKESINPGQGSWLYIATDEAYDYFHDASKPLPSDFFNDLGADGTGTGIKRWFHPFMDIVPDANISFPTNNASLSWIAPRNGRD